jgi:hypothetical protein
VNAIATNDVGYVSEMSLADVPKDICALLYVSVPRGVVRVPQRVAIYFKLAAIMKLEYYNQHM